MRTELIGMIAGGAALLAGLVYALYSAFSKPSSAPPKADCPAALAEDVQRTVAAVVLPQVQDPRGALAKAVREFESFNHTISSGGAAIATMVARNVDSIKTAQDKAARIRVFRKNTEYNNTHHYLTLIAAVHAVVAQTEATQRALEDNKNTLERTLTMAKARECDPNVLGVAEKKLRDNASLLQFNSGYVTDIDKSLNSVFVKWPVAGKIQQVSLKALIEEQKEVISLVQKNISMDVPMSWALIYLGAIGGFFVLLLLITYGAVKFSEFRLARAAAAPVAAPAAAAPVAAGP